MKYNDNGEWKDIQVKVANAVKNEYGESNNDGYSQNYLNDHTVNVGMNSTNYPVNFIKGKNLLSLVNGTYSNNGVTATVSNGIVTLSGTATATSFIRIPLVKNVTQMANELYTFSANNGNTIGTESNYAAIRMNDGGDDSSTDVLFSTANNSKDITKETPKVWTTVTIRTASGLAYSSFVISPMLEKGTHSTYEAYVPPAITVNGDTIYDEIGLKEEIDNKLEYIGKANTTIQAGNTYNYTLPISGTYKPGLVSITCSTSNYEHTWLYHVYRTNQYFFKQNLISELAYSEASNVSITFENSSSNGTIKIQNNGSTNVYLVIAYLPFVI